MKTYIVCFLFITYASNVEKKIFTAVNLFKKSPICN